MKLLLLDISGDGDHGTLYITVIDQFRLGDASESVERDEDHLNGSVHTMRSRRPSEPVLGAHGGRVLLQLPWGGFNLFATCICTSTPGVCIVQRGGSA